ncbi:MAG: heme A synthase [Myxococcota bacterium]
MASSAPSPPTFPPAPAGQVRRAAIAFGALASVAFGLIVLGSLVRAHGAGLACPDWPLCFGRVLPTFDMRIAFEWGHRALAGGLTLGLAGVTVWVLRRPALLAAIGGLLAASWGLLALQVALGGLTVLLGLAPWTVVGHLLCGNALCVALYGCSREIREHATPRPSSVAAPPATRAAVGLVGALVVLQVWLGGMVSSHYAGLACEHFPTCDGGSFAPGFAGSVGLQVSHRIGAAALGLAVVLLVVVTRRAGGQLARLARIDLALVGLQIGVGAANVWLRLPVEITALHSGLAAATVLATSLLVREGLLRRALHSSPYEAAESVQAGGAPA